MVVLTTDNLEFLRSMGLANMAVAGDEATPEEARILASMNSILESKENITDSSVTPNTTPNTPITDEENVVPSPDMADLQARLQSQQALIDSLRNASQPTTQAGPYDNLSKLQKRMLAFAGIKDAGLALQGKEGTSVSSLLKDFSDRADQKRKTLQAQRLANLYSGSGMSGGSMGDLSNMNLEQLAALRNDILSGAFNLNPMTGEALIDPNITKLKLEQVDARIAELQTSQASEDQGAERVEFLLPLINSTMSYLNPTGEVGEDGVPILNPNMKNKLSRMITEGVEPLGYQEFIGDLDTIKNTMTFENLLELKKGGATFGSLSNDELRQISTLAGSLNPANPLGTLKTLTRIQKIFQKAQEDFDRKLLGD